MTKFSTEKKGSDVMVVSSNGSLVNGFQFRDWQRTFSEGDDYHERWNQLKEQNPEPALGPQKPGQKIKLVPTRDLESEKILIDSRRPIAGNGDTASSLFLVQNLIRRGYKGVVDILVDEKSERILRSLSKNLPGFASSIRIFHESELSSEPYSMVIRSGLPSGRVFDLGLNRLGTKDTGVAGKININDSTLFLSLTIYGNTENRASVQPLSLVVSDNKYYLMPATGLGVNRSKTRA
ncbi:MAG: hypothetical protein IPM97_08150 [Bdellovibrionaceae bacterium]|nr:hypothetical protein [Pseudobdellovibrionaceae bacterium]